MRAPVGGTPVRSVAIDGSGNLFAGLDLSGGVFVSNDDGASWRPSNSGIYDLTVTATAATGTSVYAGTTNLVRSADHGASWAQVTRLFVNAATSAVAARGNLVATGNSYDGTLYVSTDGGNTFNSSGKANGATVDLEIVGSAILCATDSGVVRSVDGGVTFGPVQGISNGPLLGGNLHCDGVSTCYASAHNTNSLGPTTLLKSTDAGATWVPLGMTNTRIVAVTDEGIAYVNDGTAGTLLRSDDGGQTWKTVAWPSSSCGIPFAARGNKVLAPCVGGVYRSDDKAATWSAASGSATNGAISGRGNGVVVDASTTALGANGDIYMNAPAGLLRSSDDGATWQVIFPYASPFHVPWGCFITGQGALECRDDRGPQLMRSTDHGQTWQTIPVNPPAGTPDAIPIQVMAVGNAGSVVYVGGSEGLVRSDDDGVTFQWLKGSPAATKIQVLRSGHVIVGSTSGVFLSVDKGTTWEPSSIQLPVLEEANGDLLSLGLGGISRSTDEGRTWTSQPLGTLPSSGMCAVDGTGRFVLVSTARVDPFTNLGQPAVTYTSTDRGATWTVLTPPIPNPVVANFTVDKRGRLLAATSGGLYRLDTVSAGP